ncbi:type II toxin-antitoxin system RelE/ParE family toxin [Achromobacter anxifer]|uniref:type II toxin-antitoxin system RelE/ParE family toxin n=2 Tax=Achromobacter anxifer TaxID=1287737 RepID=UPI0023F75F19|nr:type II toxin-antitoxin system RelE/ParE family toxin [Achromobacter anxifer]MDF8365859.1 type II toxin-antitoxin system RelE/ParE family toxin [Achromobacter anxifer]
MVFVETSVFTRQITSLLTDDGYRDLQQMLLEDPACGNVIPGGGGIRKVRYARPGTGKSGGLRVIYYWITDDDQLLMLLAYPKSVRDDLTQAELAQLRALVKDL